MTTFTTLINISKTYLGDCDKMSNYDFIITLPLAVWEREKVFFKTLLCENVFIKIISTIFKI